MIQLKTLNRRIATRSQGVFYKPVVNEEEKEVDKVYFGDKFRGQKFRNFRNIITRLRKLTKCNEVSRG